MHTDERHPVPAIADHALIGDCHGAALVDRQGTIDWACLGRFDADPCFCRLLDDARGGYWSIRPAEPFEVTRHYIPGTNILQTRFTTASGELCLIDFMVVGRVPEAAIHDYVTLVAPGWLVRRLALECGSLAIQIRYKPSCDFAATSVALTQDKDLTLLSADDGPLPRLHTNTPFTVQGDTASARLVLHEGDSMDMVLCEHGASSHDWQKRLDKMQRVTRCFWQEWIGYCRYDGTYRHAVERSALTLKLLTYSPTGAIVAAPTTSLPEWIGAARNWDYRYCWVRDAAFALYSLAVLGYSGEVRRFAEFLQQACAHSAPLIRPVYGIHGDDVPVEQCLEHLAGFCDSAPVRVGNTAAAQQQIDAYGHILDLGLLYQRLGGDLDAGFMQVMRLAAHHIRQHWKEPGPGLWEMRGEARQHTHSKLMCWVGLDRAQQILDESSTGSAPADATPQDLLHYIERHGGPELHERLNQSDQGGTDAATLLAPMLGYPMSRDVLTNTIDQVATHLKSGAFIARYDGDDGLDGQEGAFVICTSWLVDALLVVDQPTHARQLLERLLASCNDVGLLAEEIDPESGRFLGNFPQALSHIGLICNAVNLELYAKGGAEALSGTYADRAQRTVGASFGWRGVLASAAQFKPDLRLQSSTESQLYWPV